MSKAYVPITFFVWDPDTETWSLNGYNGFGAYDREFWFEVSPGAWAFMLVSHEKTVQGRPWFVCTHPKFPGRYFGHWGDAGPQTPPYA